MSPFYWENLRIWTLIRPNAKFLFLEMRNVKSEKESLCEEISTANLRIYLFIIWI